MEIYEWVKTLPIKYLSHHVINSSYSLFTLGKKKNQPTMLLVAPPNFIQNQLKEEENTWTITYCTKVYTMLNKIYLLRILEMVKFKV